MIIWKRVMWIGLSLAIYLLMISIPTKQSAGLSVNQQSDIVYQIDITSQIEKAILEAVASNNRYIQGGIVTELQVTDIEISQDQLWATAWVVYNDPQSGTILPTEPALAVTHYVDNAWQVYLPSELDWQQAVYALPEDLMLTQEKEMWVAMVQGSIESYPTQTGYLLPWRGGQTASLSRSVGHDADFSTAHYAFDFYMPGGTVCPGGGVSAQGTMGLNFDIYASKAATVWGWEDSVEDCDHSKVNFIVLRNLDDPSIFQLYLHLAQNSIPDELKIVGTPVARGQFIGRADNTGASSGSHLHFQVERQPLWPPENPYWSTAIDMAFDDVDINGGRPRVSPLDPPYCQVDDVCEVFRQTYISNNYSYGDPFPPTGEISGVDTGDTVTSATLNLSGWGYDEQTGLDYGQLIGYFDDRWHDLGNPFNPDFSYTWDLCDSTLPVENGAVSIALRLYDLAGNPAPLVGLRHFVKNYSCPIPPPNCLPNQDQVAIFEDPYFRGGCVKYNIGNYPTGNSLYPLGNNDAESILVGENAIATLYSEDNFTGHSQAIITDTAYFGYQWIDGNSLSSLKVSLKSEIPHAPILINPMEASAFREGDIIPFSWQNGGGAVDYQVEIYLNSNLIHTIPWQSEPVNYFDSLAQGNYTWRVQGRNEGGLSNWSQLASFSIESPIVYPPVETVPYSDTMESSQGKWTRYGFWSYMGNPNMAHSGSHSWWYQNAYGNYDNNYPNFGSLTSPPIEISDIGYYLRFYYRYQTETQGLDWDQRWAQISVDGEPFKNLVQLYDDPQMQDTSSWLMIKAIDLSEYVGHIIRIRFQFSTLDAFENNYSGWGIDDFSITSTPPVDCTDAREDDTPDQAFLLTYDSGILVPGEICPNGDYDFYRFFGHEGDRVVVDINAMNEGSLLDSYLFLLDSDGKTVLAENDDEVYAQERDPLLSYTLLDDGEYFLKLRAWKHPLLGGQNYDYSIRLYEDRNYPVSSITWPLTDTYLPDASMTITAFISDVVDGMDRVDFYWHPTDWLTSAWEYLGTDNDGTDGWSIPFNPDGESEGSNGAFFIDAFDLAGNYAGAGAWNLGIDKTAPITSMSPLNASQPSNAFRLDWSASDNLSGIDYVEIQQKINDENWITLPPIDEGYDSYWIIGIPGNTYSYRMHGIDHSRNSETYPNIAEATTAIPDAGVLCFAPDIYDTSGNDNSPVNASMLYANKTSQIHNYCNPLSPNYENDEDWTMFEAINGQHYLVQSLANSPQTATIISLFGQDGQTLLAEAVANNYGENSALVWTSDRDEMVYIRIRHLDGRVIGSYVSNTISVKTGSWTFLPLVQHR